MAGTWVPVLRFRLQDGSFFGNSNLGQLPFTNIWKLASAWMGPERKLFVLAGGSTSRPNQHSFNAGILWARNRRVITTGATCSKLEG